MIKITKGNAITLNFTAKKTPTSVLNLTGASFATQMMGPGGKVVSFNNSKHTILVAASGTFSLTLSAADTALLDRSTEEQIKKLEGREIVTTITQSGLPFTVRASLLIVYPETPRS